MKPSKFQKAEDIFHAVADLTPKEREAHIEKTCQGDDALRALVDRLLKPSGTAINQFLQTPAYVGDDRSAAESLAKLPSNIGKYTIVRMVGEGGMGVVYEAKQENPNRTVALKVIRPELTTISMRKRFAQEVAALGRLQHPGIATVYEAGIVDEADEGPTAPPRPFFAMEFVRGQHLKKYANEHSLNTSQRMELVAQVCDAVHHAHLKGVIHRDLKPGNLLVDKSGQPKILDFGIALITDDEHQTTTLHTGLGQLVGTIPYMSPEQVVGDSTQVDTGSDVYALGVILYELLAGRPPHDLKGRSIPEAARIIRDEEPSRIGSLNTAFRGDIETILCKALEKDKSRRYFSAAELAADVRRYINDEPIIARPSSTFYQFKKYATRNKAFVGGIATTFLALLIGLVGMSKLAMRETEQRVLAEASQQVAQREASKALAVNQFLIDMLAEANPKNNPRGNEVTVAEILEAAASKIDDTLQGQPEVEAAIRGTIGAAFFELAKYDESQSQLDTAIRILRIAPGDNRSAISGLLLKRAAIHRERAEYEACEPLILEALATRIAMYGENDVRVANVRNELGLYYRKKGDQKSAARELEKALATMMATYGEAHETVALCLDNLAQVNQQFGDYDKAESLFRKSLAMRRKLYPDDHAYVAATLNNLGHLLKTIGNLDEAEPMFHESLTILRKLLGDNHPDVAVAMGNLASVHIMKREYGIALKLNQEALAIKKQYFGNEHPSIAQSMGELGYLYYRNKEYDRAENILREALEVFRKVKGNEDYELMPVLNNLQYVYVATGELDKAEHATREALTIAQNLFDANHSDVMLLSGNLAGILSKKGEHEESLSLSTKILKLTRSSVSKDHPRLARALIGMTRSLIAKGDFAAAEKTARESVSIRQATLDPDSWKLANVQSVLGECLVHLGKLPEAEALLLPSHLRIQAEKGLESEVTIQSQRRITELYDAWGKPDKAADYRRKLAKD